MNRAALAVTAVLAATVAGTGARAAAGDGGNLRVAVVVGANRGSDRTAPLAFARKDAERFARVLTEVGGVPAERLALLLDPTVAQLTSALDRADADARRLHGRSGQRVLLVFYYSGHADGISLELGRDERFPFAELRRRMESSGADVRLVFVDSCKSGGLTRDKGLSRGPSFDLSLSGQLEATGTAYVTSSSASESAQESAEMGGSYFTQFLLSALRGAADSDGNGLVTLGEAYRYAYAKTVRETALTMAGTQHPSYSYRLGGRGDVNLADLRGGESGLVFPAGAGGEYLVLDEQRREVIAEVLVPAGEKRRLAVPAATYVVGRRDGRRFLAARVTAARGVDASVDGASLRPTTLRWDGTKGWSEESTLVLGASYGIVGGALGAFSASQEPSLSLRIGVGDRWAVVPRAGFGFASVNDQGFLYDYRAVIGEVALQRHIRTPIGDAWFGPGVGGAWAEQRLLSAEAQKGLLARTFAALALELPLGGDLHLAMGWDAGATWAEINGRMQTRLLLRASIGVAYGF